MASHQPRHRFIVEDVGDVAAVGFVDKSIHGELNIQMIGDDLFRLVDDLGRRKVLLNFSNVEFMSSAAFGKLLTLHRKLQDVQGKLVLVGLIPEIRDVFRITKFDRLVTLVDTEAEAYAIFDAMPAPAGTSAPTPRPETQLPHDEPHPLEGILTADDIRQIESGGLTLGDAIQSIEGVKG